MKINAQFDSGNIRVLGIDNTVARLEIVKDAGGEHSQWFHFKVSGLGGEPAVLRIENAHTTSYPKAWNGYRAAASVDRELWTRLDTSYEDGALVIQVPEDMQTLWVAYFAPFSFERHQDLIGGCIDLGATHEVLGQTLDGADLDLLILGDGPKPIWVIGETAPRREHGRMVDGGLLGPVARRQRCADAKTPHRRHLVHRAEHEPRRKPARTSSLQRQRSKPESRMGNTDHGALARGEVGS